MAYPLRQSTASQEILLGPFLSSTDGDTERTGLTIANTDIKLFKHGGSAQVNKNSGGATHDANGKYVATLDATDTDTLGGLEINVHVSTALPVKKVCVVLAQAVFDAFYGSGNLPANVKAISDDSTAADNLELAIEDAPGYVNKGTAQAGAAGSITLASGANSTTNDIYRGHIVQILSGTGTGQARLISGYTAATRVATVAENWLVNPSTDSVYVVLPGANAIADVNVVQISGDATAADNAEAAFDGSGYNVGNGDVVVTTVTGNVEGGILGNLVDLENVLEDSIPTDGTAPSVRQALYMLTQFMLERAVSGTTMTVRKPNGSTALFTLTLSDATNPTSITRAT